MPTTNFSAERGSQLQNLQTCNARLARLARLAAERTDDAFASAQIFGKLPGAATVLNGDRVYGPKTPAGALIVAVLNARAQGEDLRLFSMR